MGCPGTEPVTSQSEIGDQSLSITQWLKCNTEALLKLHNLMVVTMFL